MGLLRKKRLPLWQETKRVFLRQSSSWTPMLGLQVISSYRVYLKHRITGAEIVEERKEKNVAIQL